MIRVLSVIHYPFFGGPQNQVLRLANPLRERGFSTLAVLPDEPGNAFDRLSAADVDVLRMNLGRVRARLDWRVQRDSMRTIAGDVPRLTKLIRTKRIDLVVVHGLINPQAAIAARLCRRPVVWQVLDTSAPRVVRASYGPLVRLLASTVMATGRAVADAHPGLPHAPGRLFMFFPPVDTRVFAPDDSQRESVREELGFKAHEVTVGCVANFSPQKRLETFLAVARSVCEARDDVRFVLFGRPMETHAGYAAALLDGAADLRKRGRLVVLDVGTDVARYLRALDIFLATALSEGIPTTVLEAMSSGIPIVSTDVGGVREAVTHGTTGFVAPLGETVPLVDHTMELIQNADLRHALATASRERAVRDFDVQRCADVHVRAFDAALRRNSR